MARPPAHSRHRRRVLRRGNLPSPRDLSATWARLIAKVFHADPLTCRKCGGKLEIVAYLHDQGAIKRILDHLGLSPPEDPKPPPAVYDVIRVPLDKRVGRSRRPDGRQTLA